MSHSSSSSQQLLAAPTSTTELAQQFENGAIYVLLFLRGAEPGYHWGIWVPRASPHGHLWHVSNRSGGWRLEIKPYNAPASISLCLAFKVGTASDWGTFTSTLEAVPAVGPHSRNGETFSCRTWVEDALYDLHVARVIVLTKSIAEIEAWALTRAAAYKTAVERGRGLAGVYNDL